MERSCWLIRAGEESRLAPTFDVAATVVVGWGDIPGLGDLTGLSRDAVVAVLEREPASDADAGELLVFRDDVKTGDAVVAFGTPELDLLVGEVTGEYEYRAQPSDGDYAHVRTVRWYARTGRDGLPGAMDEPPADRQSIRPLTPSAEWLVLTDSLRATDAPPVKAPTKTAVAKAAAATKAAARKAAAAVPKPPAKLRSRAGGQRGRRGAAEGRFARARHTVPGLRPAEGEVAVPRRVAVVRRLPRPARRGLTPVRPTALARALPWRAGQAVPTISS